jgi:hypothetical protein
MDKKFIPIFKNEPIVVLLLGFITCGFYYIYWNIKVAEVFNNITGKELINPIISVLAGLCMPVHVYYYYLVGQGLDITADMINRPDLKNKGVLLMILGFVLAPVAAMIVQGHLNEIYEASSTN